MLFEVDKCKQEVVAVAQYFFYDNFIYALCAPTILLFPFKIKMHQKTLTLYFLGLLPPWDISLKLGFNRPSTP